MPVCNIQMSCEVDDRQQIRQRRHATLNCRVSLSAFLLLFSRVLVLGLLLVKNTGNGW